MSFFVCCTCWFVFPSKMQTLFRLHGHWLEMNGWWKNFPWTVSISGKPTLTPITLVCYTHSKVSNGKPCHRSYQLSLCADSLSLHGTPTGHSSRAKAAFLQNVNSIQANSMTPPSKLLKNLLTGHPLCSLRFAFKISAWCFKGELLSSLLIKVGGPTQWTF